MSTDPLTEGLAKEAEEEKLVLLVLDGVGDVRHPDFGGRTPLEVAVTPNMDALVGRSACGRIIPVDYGVTPGSGPAHLGLFGYDPRELEIGRGVLEALGIEMDLELGDVAARCNFCTVEGDTVVDRRAGRPETEESAKKCKLLQEELGTIDGVELEIKAGKGHRFAVIFRGAGLEGSVSDTDPHEDNEKIHTAEPLEEGSAKLAEVVNTFQQKALEVLEGGDPINGLIVRGVAERPRIPGVEDRYGLRCGAIATYPMYRGLAKLVGMDLLDTGQTIEDEFQTCIDNWNDYDYFFVHVKGTDEAGEDGDFRRKVSVIEEVDEYLPMLTGQDPEALAITGDHSTPCCMKLHSWHPVPLMMHSPRCDASGLPRFTEKHCNSGGLGIFRAKHLLPLMMANAGLLDKYGA